MGSGNQSDDEMAFMSFYNLIQYTQDEALRRQFMAAFYWYWTLEQPERNPFFHFAYAASAMDSPSVIPLSRSRCPPGAIGSRIRSTH